jgi:hypothetical protein
MSARSPNYTREIAKSRAEIKKAKGTMYKSSFGDLPDGTIYRDPAGWKTPGRRGENPSELQKSRWQQLATEPIASLAKHVGPNEDPTLINAWNSLQQKGFDVADTTDEIRKSLDTGDWTLPLDIIPEVFVVNPEQTPMADLMTRVTTQDDEVVATPVEADPEPSFGLEAPDVTEDAEGNYQYEYEQPTYGDLSYTVEGLGMATRISDKMILSSANLRNAEATQEQSAVRGMRKKTERQIIHGTDAAQGGDANGYQGFADIGTVIDDLGDPASLVDTPEDIEDATRDVIEEAEYAGAPREDLAVVCDFDWHKGLRESLTNDVRYEAGAEEAGAFTSLVFEDVPVYKSHAIDRLGDIASGETRNSVYAVNMNSTYLSMLRETSVNPLAKLGPQERIGVDAYGCLTAEAPSHIQSYTVTAP